MRVSYLFIAAALALTACSGGDNHEGHDHEAEGHNHEAEGHEGHDHDHEAEKAGDEIVIEPGDAKKFGIEVAKLEPGAFHDVIRVSGQFEAPATDAATISAKSSGILRLRAGLSIGSKIGAGSSIGTISTQGVQGGNITEATRVEMEAARREMERLKPLADDGIVTRREYNAAVAAYQNAKARMGSARVHPGVVSPISGTITSILAQDGQYVEVGAPIATVSKDGNRMVLRADVPERYSTQVNAVKSAKFKPSSSCEVLSLDNLGGKLTSAPKNGGTTGNRGYIPVYFTFNNKDNSLVPGGFTEVYLITNSTNGALTVPIGAITEAQGIKYVYVKIDEEGYEKRPVEIGGSDGERVELLSGVQAGDDVVVKGTTFVRLAETKAVPEGHTHNH